MKKLQTTLDKITTLISAILFLTRQKWRTSVNRAAEAMTIFAVMCAGIFPLIHVGRPWLAFWLFPYPNERALWPNFRSPLLWDVFAVSTYFSVSAMFWYLGLVPDIASMRDRTENKWKKLAYTALSLGWRGSGEHWQHYEKAYTLQHGWLYNRKPGKIVRNTLKYQRIDVAARERLRAEWNRPILWPLLVVGLLGALIVAPAVTHYRRRERAGADGA